MYRHRHIKLKNQDSECVSPLCGAQPFFTILFKEEEKEEQQEEEEDEQFEHHGGEPADFTFIDGNWQG